MESHSVETKSTSDLEPPNITLSKYQRLRAKYRSLKKLLKSYDPNSETHSAKTNNNEYYAEQSLATPTEPVDVSRRLVAYTMDSPIETPPHEIRRRTFPYFIRRRNIKMRIIKESLTGKPSYSNPPIPDHMMDSFADKVPRTFVSDLRYLLRGNPKYKESRRETRMAMQNALRGLFRKRSSATVDLGTKTWDRKNTTELKFIDRTEPVNLNAKYTPYPADGDYSCQEEQVQFEETSLRVTDLQESVTDNSIDMKDDQLSTCFDTTRYNRTYQTYYVENQGIRGAQNFLDVSKPKPKLQVPKEQNTSNYETNNGILCEDPGLPSEIILEGGSCSSWTALNLVESSKTSGMAADCAKIKSDSPSVEESDIKLESATTSSGCVTNTASKKSCSSISNALKSSKLFSSGKNKINLKWKKKSSESVSNDTSVAEINFCGKYDWKPNTEVLYI